MLESIDIDITVADARFCKPLDTDLITQLANHHEVLITIEEGSIGGFGSHVSHFLSLSGILDGPLKASLSGNVSGDHELNTTDYTTTLRSVHGLAYPVTS